MARSAGAVIGPNRIRAEVGAKAAGVLQDRGNEAVVPCKAVVLPACRSAARARVAVSRMEAGETLSNKPQDLHLVWYQTSAAS